MQALPRGVDRLDRGVPSHRRSPVVVEGVDRRDRRRHRRALRGPWPQHASGHGDGHRGGRPDRGPADDVTDGKAGRREGRRDLHREQRKEGARRADAQRVHHEGGNGHEYRHRQHQRHGPPRGPIGGRRFVDRAADDRAERGRDHHHSAAAETARHRTRYGRLSRTRPRRRRERPSRPPDRDRVRCRAGRAGRRRPPPAQFPASADRPAARAPARARAAPGWESGEGLRSTRILTLRNGRGRDRIRRTGNVAYRASGLVAFSIPPLGGGDRS